MFRNLMSAKVRSNAGCWTCRLRRKKCDERRPVCEGCRSLEITCHFEDEKPAWMDGGAKQKEMGDKIKAQVKKQASQRRDRKYMEMLESGTKNVRLEGNDEAPQRQSKPDLHFCQESSASGVGASQSDQDPMSSSYGRSFKMTPPSSNTSGGSPPEIPWASERQEDGGLDIDVHFTMIYLDYVFPYLFPYYRPPILSGGRGWVLDILQSNKSVYYTAISLASYFFGVLLANGDKSHEECTERMAGKLQGQLEMGLKELQKEMRTINARSSTFNTYEGLVTMQSILQMVVFEVATTNEDNWKMHLDAAFAMFFRILPDPEKWTETLHGLYTTRWPPPEMGLRRPWSTNQAAFRFFTANLVHMDVMSSIALERPPRLREYQDAIIPGCFSKRLRQDAQTAGPLFMDDFVGLNNWIIQMIGDVASLHAWKKEQRAAGTLSVDDLVSRSEVLANTITVSLSTLESQCLAHNPQSVMTLIVEDPLPELEPMVKNEQGFHPAMAVHNNVWLRGILVYLYTVVLGWQPSNPVIREHVSRMTEILSQLPKGACIRGMVFPFCLAGCLAPLEDEDKYRAMLSRLGALKVFGTIKEASEIMEKVWSCRDQIDENWDVAKCLRILGHQSLLI